MRREMDAYSIATRSRHSIVAALCGAAMVLAWSGCGDDLGNAEGTSGNASTTDGCVPGSHGCPCISTGQCAPGLVCIEDLDLCANAGESGAPSSTTEPSGDATTDAAVGDATTDAAVGDTTSSGSSPQTDDGSPETSSTGGTDSSSTDGSSSDTDEPTCDGTPDTPVLPTDCGEALLATDVLLAGEVYLAGTLSEGACYLDALAHWSTPNDAVAGFDCYFNEAGAAIRPTDGRLLYTNTFEGYLREFHCDTCPINSVPEYPNAPLTNDFILPTPACAPEDTTSLAFLVAPGGDYVYRCANGSPWHDALGAVVYDDEGDELLHLGYDGLALTESSILDLETGIGTPIACLPAGGTVTVRAEPGGGFFVVKTPEQPELWHVAVDGTAFSMGIYAPAPVGYSAYGWSAKLDVCGNLFRMGAGPMVFEDVLLRSPLEGETEVVYTETTDPLVKIHISRLVTGP